MHGEIMEKLSVPTSPNLFKKATSILSILIFLQILLSFQTFAFENDSAVSVFIDRMSHGLVVGMTVEEAEKILNKKIVIHDSNGISKNGTGLVDIAKLTYDIK